MDIHYITIREFSDFHQVQVEVVESFLKFGIVDSYYQGDEPCIADTDIEDVEAAMRLHRDLNVNLEGIDIILQMRKRLLRLQQRLTELEGRNFGER